MIDVHCHLNFHAYEKDVDEIIHKAHADGVTTIINVGTKIDSSHKALELAQTYDNLYAIVGVHPHHADTPLRHSGHDPESSGILKLVQDDKTLGIFIYWIPSLAEDDRARELGLEFF